MKKIGREVLFISSKQGNPRNGEGAFIRLKSGVIMFGYTEFFGDSFDDDAAARICAVFSADEGETWSERRVLFEKPENAGNIMCLSFLRMNNGDIGAFYIAKNFDRTDKILFRRSSDEGETWTEPINTLDCLDKADYYVINNDRVLRLKNGRIIYGAARHTVLNTDKDFTPGVICFFASDDDGRRWYKINAEFPCPYASNPDGYEEPGLYEFPDGRLWCYIRTSLGFQFETFSADGGLTWSEPDHNMFFSSACSPMLVKDCGEKTVAVFNPEPEHILRPESEPWGRTPYVLAVSDDRAKTFEKAGLYYLEDDRTNGYCYPAIISGDNYFLVAYYHSNNTDNCLDSTKIIKVMFEEI